MKILFPSEPFSPKEIDSAFKAEFEAANMVGFKTFLFDHDEFIKKDVLSTNLPTNAKEGDETIILRSWMLKEEQYMSLYGRLFGRGYSLKNTPKEYLNVHHFPNVYTKISAHTAKSWWTPDWLELENPEKTDWKSVRDYLGGDVLIKDYVKSEKGNMDLFVLSKELTNVEFYEKILKFIEARGKLFNKGIVFKQIESLKKYDGHTNEWRIFIFDDELLLMDYNGTPGVKTKLPSFEIIMECHKIAKTIENKFITIDVAEKEDGLWMILEAGDGQVSGMPAESTAIGFYNKLKERLSE